MKMARSEYDSHNCFLRQQEEIAKQKLENSRLQGEITKLKRTESKILLIPFLEITFNNLTAVTRQTSVLENTGASSSILAQSPNHLSAGNGFFKVGTNFGYFEV